MYDLILRNGHLIDPGNGLDRRGAIAFSEGKIAAIDPPEDAPSRRSIDAGGRIVSPGLIDMHTHVYYGGTSLGVEPDGAASRSAATTLVDAGSAGAANFAGLRRFVIEAAGVRVLAFLNISFAGIFGFGKDFSVGEGADRGLLQTNECRRTLEENRDLLVGVKARIGPSSSGVNEIEPLRRALAVAEQVDLPVMVHIERAPPNLADVVAMLRAGDILTHCCRPVPNAVVPEDGTVLEACLRARERGVFFDVGHGRGSFSFRSFQRMAEAGFLPDIVSSDIHAFNCEQNVDLLTTMSKLLALCIPIGAVIGMATAAPARALRRADLGALRPGAEGDVSVLELVSGEVTLMDSIGESLTARQSLAPAGTVRAGRWCDA